MTKAKANNHKLKPYNLEELLKAKCKRRKIKAITRIYINRHSNNLKLLNLLLNRIVSLLPTKLKLLPEHR